MGARSGFCSIVWSMVSSRLDLRQDIGENPENVPLTAIGRIFMNSQGRILVTLTELNEFWEFW
jgi:hypothetical protein